MDASKLRAWWWHKQALDGNSAGQTPAELLTTTGWARSVAGAGPYLTLFARGGFSRALIDSAVAKLEIHELPSARGCTYVLPACDYALGLRAGQAFSGGDMKVALKLGVTSTEIYKLCTAVVDALAKGPLAPDALREATGGAARSLGEEGKKKGLTTTLPLALGRLQSEGEIRRVPVNGRLDQQRYSYTLWRPNPLEKFRLTADEAYVELARRYFRWTGPASPAHFQWFSGLGVKAAKLAIEPLDLVPVEEESDLLMFRDDLEDFQTFKASKTPQYALVSSLDALLLLRRDLISVLAEADLKQEVGRLSDLPSHAIFDRGRLVGLWEYDTETESIAYKTFGSADKALEQAVAQTEAYIRTDLGDARSFSLDSPKSRAPRIAALRKSAS